MFSKIWDYLKMTIFGPKNFEKNTVENDKPKMDAPKIDAFSSFQHYLNVSIFGQPRFN